MDQLSEFLASPVQKLEMRIVLADVANLDPISYRQQSEMAKQLSMCINEALANGSIRHVSTKETMTENIVILYK